MSLMVSPFFKKRKFHKLVDLDACLNGMGAVCGKQIYQTSVPYQFLGHNIATIEMLNILVSLNIWADQWNSTVVRIACDNEAVVKVLNSGHTRCPHLGAIARNIFMKAAKNDIALHIVHIPGKENNIADLLSRWDGSNAHKIKLDSLISDYQWKEVSCSHKMVDHDI